MWVLGLLVFLPLLTAGLLFFIQGDRLRDAVVKVSAAAIATFGRFFSGARCNISGYPRCSCGFLLYLRPVSPVLDSAFGSNSAGSGSMV